MSIKDPNAYARAWRAKPENEANAKARSWRKNNPAKYKANQRKYRWKKQGIILTVQEFVTRCDLAGNVCQICQRPGKLVPDHDHETGQLRGVLCMKCNRALGAFGDNEAGINKVLEYLCRSK